MELWAAIDLMGGSAVTLVRGEASERTVWAARPLEFARRWQEEGADGLHVVDLDAAFGTGSNAETARMIIKESSVPVQVGGGVRSERAASGWLAAGAARVILGTLAFSDKAAARKLLEEHGAERLVVAADYRDGKIVTKGWKETEGVDVVVGARRLAAEGFRNLLATAVGRDGTGSGPDVATVVRLSEETRLKLIASGGIRDVDDVLELKRAGASAAVIGRALCEGSFKLAEARRRLA